MNINDELKAALDRFFAIAASPDASIEVKKSAVATEEVATAEVSTETTATESTPEVKDEVAETPAIDATAFDSLKNEFATMKSQVEELASLNTKLTDQLTAIISAPKVERVAQSAKTINEKPKDASDLILDLLK